MNADDDITDSVEHEDSNHENEKAESLDNDSHREDRKIQGDEEDILLVELKYCTVCNLEQPLRSKHCRECKQCVATFDHHCCWMGTCIGERNRRVFYVYLITQSCAFFTLAMIELMNIRLISILSIPLTCFFLLFTFFLVFVHTMLAANNLTTWESLSWMKISYMKIWPRKYGSPFFVSYLENI